MGIISRFTDIMSANINSILQKAEGKNADKLLEKYLSDAKENLGQIKAETAAVIAEEMSCGRKLAECEELCSKYKGYAVAAVKAGNDEDARKFLIHQNDEETKKAGLLKQYELAKQNSEKMRQMTQKLTSDIEVMQSRLTELKQKLDVAKQQEKLNKLNEKIGKDPMGNYDNLFESVQKRIDEAEAKAQLNAEQSSKTDELDDLMKKYDSNNPQAVSTSVDEQLKRLKESLE